MHPRPIPGGEKDATFLLRCGHGESTLLSGLTSPSESQQIKEHTMSRKLSRRDFVKAGAVSATAAGFWLTGGVTETRAAQGANDRLNIAVIGCGGQGQSDLGNVAS